MKNLKYFTAAILCLAISAGVNGQFRKTVYGDGNVVKKERTAGSFTGVKVSTGIDVFLSQGDKMSLSVETDENLQEYILTEVRDNVLHVYTDVNIRKAELKRVYVAMKEINYLSTSSAGDLNAYDFKVREADISVSSAGNADIYVTERLKARASSAGDVNYKGNPKYLDANSSSAGGIHSR